MTCVIHGDAWCTCPSDREPAISELAARLIYGLRCPSCGTAGYQPNPRCTAHEGNPPMSFHVSATGTPDELKARLAEESGRLFDQSKAEFDAIRPALETVLDQNVGDNVHLQLTASGHASFQNGQKTQGQCNVEIKRV